MHGGRAVIAFNGHFDEYPCFHSSLECADLVNPAIRFVMNYFARKALVGKIIPKTEQIKRKSGDEYHASGGGCRGKMRVGKGVVAYRYGADNEYKNSPYGKAYHVRFFNFFFNSHKHIYLSFDWLIILYHVFSGLSIENRHIL